MMGTGLPPGMALQIYGAYIQVMFAMAFSSGGFAIAETAFKPGEWVRWQLPADRPNQVTTLERAFLGEDGTGVVLIGARAAT
jgi:hypothetical protein